MARADVQLHGLHPDYITYSVIYMGYENISYIALCINRIKPPLSYAQNTWIRIMFFTNMKVVPNVCMVLWYETALPVFIVFIVHIAIYIVGD